MSTSNKFVSVYQKDYVEAVTKNFKSYLDNDLYIDLVFVCRNNKKVGAHQIVLGCLSKFFYSIFIENLNTAREKVLHVYVPDIRAKIMKYILQFVYSGKAMLNKEELAEFNEDIKLLGMPLDLFSWPNEDISNSESVNTSASVNTTSDDVPTTRQIIPDTVDLTELGLTEELPSIVDTNSRKVELPATRDPVTLSPTKKNSQSFSHDTANDTFGTSRTIPQSENSTISINSDLIIVLDGDPVSKINKDEICHTASTKEPSDAEASSSFSDRKRRIKNQLDNSDSKKNRSAWINLEESDDDADVITLS